ncbi:MAG: hypothetical protein KDC49_23275, partial [Saprospiraceae bacterium]|nr:hypothetical protein [Saprospiraceae bacterium]
HASLYPDPKGNPPNTPTFHPPTSQTFKFQFSNFKFQISQYAKTLIRQFPKTPKTNTQRPKTSYSCLALPWLEGESAQYSQLPSSYFTNFQISILKFQISNFPICQNANKPTPNLPKDQHPKTKDSPPSTLVLKGTL